MHHTHPDTPRIVSPPDIRGFPKVDHLGIDTRIVLEHNNFSKKKLPLTGLELQTPGL